MESLLFTGSSGFLGRSILSKLSSLYSVSTLSTTSSSTYCCDLSKAIPSLGKSHDLVLHAAGKAHSIPSTSRNSEEFFEVNLQGTKNLCKALEVIGPPRALVFISTVAVYGIDSGDLITEDQPLNGTSPYALSKIRAEAYLGDWCSRNAVRLSILRPALLAGINPPGNLGAMIRGIRSGGYFNLGNGSARKSIAWAEDIAQLLPLLSSKTGVYNFCDDQNPSFAELAASLADIFGVRTPMSLPVGPMRVLAKVGSILSTKFPLAVNTIDKMTMSLTFSNHRLKRELNFVPSNVIHELSRNASEIRSGTM